MTQRSWINWCPFLVLIAAKKSRYYDSMKGVPDPWNLLWVRLQPCSEQWCNASLANILPYLFERGTTASQRQFETEKVRLRELRWQTDRDSGRETRQETDQGRGRRRRCGREMREKHRERETERDRKIDRDIERKRLTERDRDSKE